jgi:hypothetical protein
MRIKEITVPVKIQSEDGTEFVVSVHHKYNEIERLSDIRDLQMSDDDKIRTFNYGMDILERGKVRSANNFGSLAKKLVDNGVFDTIKEALEFILTKRGIKVED